MPCYNPQFAYRGAQVNENGKRPLVFSPTRAINNEGFELPCNYCIGCRKDQARDWQLRIMHEASLYNDNNCFLTLTYDDYNLPGNHSLNHEHVQLFLKRLRKKYPAETIRYYMAGEYGDLTYRPHYHVILFNHSFPDQVKISTKNGLHTYNSQILDRIWSMGHCTVQPLTLASARYCSNYLLKKQRKNATHTYYYTDRHGEIHRQNPPYARMSTKPGIGAAWYRKYAKDVQHGDFVVLNGQKSPVPKYYDYIRQFRNPEEERALRHIRRTRAKQQKPIERTTARRQVKERIAQIKQKASERPLDQEPKQ